MIEIEHLSKRYENTLAMDDVSFVVQPRMVTGFLGPMERNVVERRSQAFR